MDKHCGDTLDMVHGLKKFSIRLKLTADYYYKHDMNCMLTLETAEDQQLMFHFEDMSVEWSSSCKNDWLMLHDGGSINSPTVSGKIVSSIYLIHLTIILERHHHRAHHHDHHDYHHHQFLYFNHLYNFFNFRSSREILRMALSVGDFFNQQKYVDIILHE